MERHAGKKNPGGLRERITAAISSFSVIDQHTDRRLARTEWRTDARSSRGLSLVMSITKKDLALLRRASLRNPPLLLFYRRLNGIKLRTTKPLIGRKTWETARMQ